MPIIVLDIIKLPGLWERLIEIAVHFKSKKKHVESLVIDGHEECQSTYENFSMYK